MIRKQKLTNWQLFQKANKNKQWTRDQMSRAYQKTKRTKDVQIPQEFYQNAQRFLKRHTNAPQVVYQQQPVYQQPVYQQPVYQQQYQQQYAYQQPVYQQQYTYQQPVYQQYKAAPPTQPQQSLPKFTVADIHALQKELDKIPNEKKINHEKVGKTVALYNGRGIQVRYCGKEQGCKTKEPRLVVAYSTEGPYGVTDAKMCKTIPDSEAIEDHRWLSSNKYIGCRPKESSSSGATSAAVGKIVACLLTVGVLC